LALERVTIVRSDRRNTTFFESFGGPTPGMTCAHVSSAMRKGALAVLTLSVLANLAGCEDAEHVRARPEGTLVAGQAPAQIIAVEQPSTVVVQPPRGEIVAIGSRPMGLSDLRSLARQTAWDELVDHLEDIPPASRDAEWRSLAQQAGLGALTLSARKGPSDALYLSEALLQRYPALKESKEFMSKRAELGAQAFERCFQKSPRAEVCATHLKAFVEADTTNQDLAFRLGKLLPQNAYGRLAVPAYAIAIQKKDDPRCQDADVQRAVLSGLSLPRAGNEDVVAESIQLGGSLCWKALQSAITDRMGGDSTDYLKNTCPFALGRQALSSLLTKRCEALQNDSNQP
jgi:hypothetical protein